jgi:hypothetical protein
MSAAQRKAQTTALVALLQALPQQQLMDVLASLEAHGRITVHDQGGTRRRRRCGVCGLSYPLCRQRWSEDHEFEAPHASK